MPPRPSILDYIQDRSFLILKEEEVRRNDYDDITEAKARIGHFIEQVCNQKCPHSGLGYLTPVEFEQQYFLNFADFWSKLTLALH